MITNLNGNLTTLLKRRQNYHYAHSIYTCLLLNITPKIINPPLHYCFERHCKHSFSFCFYIFFIFADVFKFDEQYETNEDKYKGLSKEILESEASGSDPGSGSGSGSESESGDSSDSEQKGQDGDQVTTGDIIDNTETNIIALRRTIYLTINSSLDYEECAHKLMKMQLKPGQEVELCHMFLDCCAEQRTYEKFYGLLAQRFCAINKIYIEPFEEIFKDTYQTTHRLDTNRLRNVSKFFSHLLFTDAISWDVLECIKLNEDDTTSSSRIFIKILFQELAEYMGLGKLNTKLKDNVLTESLTGLFPKDNPRNTRFAINFFTSIGLGGLTDELRQFLKNAPKSVPAIFKIYYFLHFYKITCYRLRCPPEKKKTTQSKKECKKIKIEKKSLASLKGCQSLCVKFRVATLLHL
ncbi:pre-mRNA-splicing factor CWC22 homolog [Rhagoletis pomonella]|uniref:pre-mRNA-splicing factor CWC22 homolog n=1 Tax=Rhagoletis pomonella TaxID=28610 RepID=UPI0017848B68|nr:pre-mRNA-splicing factor CWC22 homolog [Rhagoletis pomonella]